MVCRKSVCALMEPPSATQLQIILQDTNEINEEKLKHNECQIQEWMKYQEHFPKNVDPLFVRSMLRGSKHILEKAKQKLENNLAARHLYPEIYKNRSPFQKDVAKAMDVANIAVMPKLTPKGLRIIIFRLHRPEPHEFNIYGGAKLFFMLYDLLMSSDCYFAGDITVFDATHFSGSHMAQFFGPIFKIFDALPKQGYAMRLKEVHIINIPTILNKMMNVIKKSLHPKVRNFIYIHENPTDLANVFGPEYVPSDYGGNLKSLREIACDWYEVLNDNADWFEAQEHVKIISIPKKIHTKFSMSDQLGVEGSFRKLSID
ncbi:hypothetical protein ABEB36_014314 [Hypothenemus hampei]